ncbi:MAG: DUF4388 domain-containing protein [Deltaproteobacteria bacterium]|nr:DUF4388 domain-containing protein [Deltaproteobacteria bacterium]
MENKNNKISDAFFIVVNENSCPYYDLGDEIKVENSSLVISSFKPVCLFLSDRIESIVKSKETFSRFRRPVIPKNHSSSPKSKYNCGGCTGLIHFEVKQEKEYATLQMKLLKESIEQRRRQHLKKFYNMLRKQNIFKSLENESLEDFILFLDFKTILAEKVLVKKGGPGTHLYIILKGRVAVLDDNNQKISEINPGGICGEMSLLTGEPESNSLHTIDGTQVAMLSVKNFRKIIKKYPALQIFLFKLLIDRVQAVALRSGSIASGMTGDLQEVPAVDLMQLINSSQKTGSLELVLPQGRGIVYFYEGEIISAQFLNLQGKEAVYVLLGGKEGIFAYNKGIPSEFNKLHPIGGFIGLMMEGVQRLDEQNQEL